MIAHGNPRYDDGVLQSPLMAVRSLWAQRELIRQLTIREVLGRYKGSYLGILWTFLNPLILLSVFTFVFGVVFQARWGRGGENTAQVALIFFAGLIVFNVFVESVSRSPTLILANANYVKRVVFPLEVLSVVVLGSALFHALVSTVILLVAVLLVLGHLPWTIVFFPLVAVPLILLVLGLSWFISALGVYVRDIGQFITLFVTALMFLTPIFYPLTAIPQQFRFIYGFNPLSYIVEDARRVLLWTEFPDWGWVLVGTPLSALVAWLGYAWFQKARRGFADVI
ncbi:MAG TPA: ABC transporter permease [Gemmatimonadaceae bacterium]|nr:ABC transporter permease [Gemmatimonadaceae bacterium]